MIEPVMMAVCGKKPGQLTATINPANPGSWMDWSQRVISRSSGKDGVVLTRKVKTAKAAVTIMSGIEKIIAR